MSVVDISSCRNYLSSIESVERLDIFTALLTERLGRRYDELHQKLEACGKDWHAVLFWKIFNALAGSKNRAAFAHLSEIIPYRAIYQERASQQSLEALLLGASGLLFDSIDDDYIRALREDFDHFRRKYNITPMRASEWDMVANYPASNPILRLSQMATLFASHATIFNDILQLTSCEQIEKFFGVESSEYWTTHYNVKRSSDPRKKRLGRSKAQLLGINFVVPFQFAYGKEQLDESLQNRALELLEHFDSESNHIIKRWSGVKTENAYDSQAIIELNNEYCLKSRCHECRIRRRQNKLMN